MLKAYDEERRREEAAALTRARNHGINVRVEDESIHEQSPALPDPPSYTSTPLGIGPRAYFEHGLQYVQPHFDHSLLRTVLVYGIPPGTMLADIIQAVETGPLLSSQLVDTTPITGSLTARFVFVSGYHAQRFIMSATNPLAPIMFAGEIPRVALVSTPTYPSPNHITFALRNGATHRLIFSNMDPAMTLPIFERYLLVGREPHVDEVVSECVETYDGKIMVIFSSVELAMWVMAKLKAETYGQIEVSYWPGLH